MAQVVPTPFTADRTDELPVGVQLAWRLRALIASGRLAPGERLPSVRELAEWAEVNVNTVRSVYARLEADGLIATRHGRGSFVADSAGGSAEVERIAADAIAAAAAAGVDARDVAIVAMVSAGLPDIPEELPPADAADGEPDAADVAAELGLEESWVSAPEAAARRELRRQIGRLEAELAAYPPDAAPRPRPVQPAAPRIVGVAELAATRDALLGELTAARAEAVKRGRRERRAREVRDAIVADPSAHRWEVVSAAETGEDGCVTWQVSPRMGPLGALMNWWRVKVSGGCPLAPPLAAAS
jgi:DNA-binding transcriptional regulator YhcF (GntR family)